MEVLRTKKKEPETYKEAGGWCNLHLAVAGRKFSNPKTPEKGSDGSLTPLEFSSHAGGGIDEQGNRRTYGNAQ